MRPRLILIEGLPGSGKTSLAEGLCASLDAAGTRASWVPELQPDHPVIDRATMRTARAPGYAGRCIRRWEGFSRAVRCLPSRDVLILEGCLFQGTVRFLVEHERSSREIAGTLPAVEACLAPLHPRLVYLTQTDTEAHLERELVRRKGAETVSRIAAYSETTPYATSRGLRGSPALTSLYVSYREVCDGLVRRTRMPVLELDAVRLGEAEVRDRAYAWVSAALRAGGRPESDRARRGRGQPDGPSFRRMPGGPGGRPR